MVTRYKSNDFLFLNVAICTAKTTQKPSEPSPRNQATRKCAKYKIENNETPDHAETPDHTMKQPQIINITVKGPMIVEIKDVIL